MRFRAVAIDEGKTRDDCIDDAGHLGAPTPMEPLASLEPDETALAAALEAESQYKRIWLPPEPWWDALKAEKNTVASAIYTKLRRGGTWPRSDVVDVRKPGHGIRPVSVMSPDVRVAYRALASALVPADDRPDRSAVRYAEFVMEPVRAAYDHQSGLRPVGDAKYSHLLVADIAAFYQYIDHAVLRDEFDLASAEIGLVDGLVGLLGDIEGRSFGIPQRSEPSDWISELYAGRLERWLVRDGFDVWRYSDDFRVGCTSYPETLRAVESLSRAARDVGLVLNDQKTATPSFLTYLMHNADVEIHDASAQIDPSDVEAAVSSDYPPEDDDQAVADSDRTISRLWDPEEAGRPASDEEWDLRNLNTDQHRAVRRALNTLTQHSDPSAMTSLLSILAYQPAMTHRVIGYAEAISANEPSLVEQFFDKVIDRLSLNEWQRAWIAFGLRASALSIAGDPKRERWLQTQFADRTGSLSAAESAVALADAGLVSFESLEGRLRTVSPDLAPWYLHAIAILNRAGGASTSQIGAIKHSSAIAAAILK